MLQRCKNPKVPHYGAKGIAVCERWRDFANFLADMGEKPEGMTIDRIDSSRGYSAENCRWVSAKDQNWNKSDTVLVRDKGEMVPLKEVARRHGLTYQRLHFWFRRRKLPLDEAIRNAGLPPNVARKL